MILTRGFAPPEVEQRYVTSEREARIQTTRTLAMIGIVSLFGFIILNPSFMPREAIAEYNRAAGIFIAALAGFYALTRTRFYVEQSWVDLPVFLAITGSMILTILALWGNQAEISGFSNYGVAVINIAYLLFLATVVFVASTRYFLLWIALLAAGGLVFLGLVDWPFNTKMYFQISLGTFFAFAVYMHWDADRRARRVFAANEALAAERAKTEELLYNVQPQEVAARLRAGEAVADSFADASVIFVDIVGFSQLAKTLSPGHLVTTLNRFFSIADECADRHGVEKVKTIGDAYLAVSGGMASGDQGAEAAIAFARDLIARMQAEAEASGLDIAIRTGIHSGPVVGGVVCSSRLAYDYWGDTMNIASRIEGAASPNGIAVSAATYYQVQNSHPFEPPETILLKGIGETQVYRLRV